MNEQQLAELTYVLLFIMNQKINNKVSWYFSVHPTHSLSPSIDSGHRDNYMTDLHGDAHLCGLMISLNNTFTARGQCAPIFACIYGLKPNEMSRNEIVVCKCCGLVAASNTNGSTDDGFLVFI